MKPENSNTNKKEKSFALKWWHWGIIVIIPGLLNLITRMDQLSWWKTVGAPMEWISFWGTYISAVLVFFTIYKTQQMNRETLHHTHLENVSMMKHTQDITWLSELKEGLSRYFSDFISVYTIYANKLIEMPDFEYQIETTINRVLKETDELILLGDKSFNRLYFYLPNPKGSQDDRIFFESLQKNALNYTSVLKDISSLIRDRIKSSDDQSLIDLSKQDIEKLLNRIDENKLYEPVVHYIDNKNKEISDIN